MTRIVVLPGDESACGFYRLRNPARVVAAAKPEWQIDVYKPSDVRLGMDDRGILQAIYGIDDPKSIDLLVMQRVGTYGQLQLLNWANQNGIATVVDSDDAMWCIDKANTAWGAWNGDPKNPHKAHWRWLDRAMDLADLVTVTTPALASRYGKHGRVEILPNYVPDSLFEVPNHTAEQRSPALGWSGFTSTHPHDLKVVQEAVSDALRDFPHASARVLGDAEGAARDWRISADQVEELPPAAIGESYYEELSRLGLGLVPLRDTKFNRGKSHLKALEMSAVGLPVIASDLPETRALARILPITLAATPKEWHDAIASSFNNWEESQQTGAYAARLVRESLTYEYRASMWCDAWGRALNRAAAVRKKSMATV